MLRIMEKVEDSGGASGGSEEKLDVNSGLSRESEDMISVREKN